MALSSAPQTGLVKPIRYMAQMRTYCYYTNDLRMNSHWTYNHPFLDDIFIPSFFLSFFFPEKADMARPGLAGDRKKRGQTESRVRGKTRMQFVVSLSLSLSLSVSFFSRGFVSMNGKGGRVSERGSDVGLWFWLGFSNRKRKSKSGDAAQWLVHSSRPQVRDFLFREKRRMK